MSCYLCDPTHIGALASYVTDLRQHHTGYLSRLFEPEIAASAGEDVTENLLPEIVALALARENIASVAHRYPHDGDGQRPGPADMTDLDYGVACVQAARDRWPHYDPVQVLKAADCYEYQSCEHPGWPESRAHDVLTCVRKAAISTLPDYDAAEWGWPERPLVVVVCDFDYVIA